MAANKSSNQKSITDLLQEAQKKQKNDTIDLNGLDNVNGTTKETSNLDAQKIIEAAIEEDEKETESKDKPSQKEKSTERKSSKVDPKPKKKPLMMKAPEKELKTKKVSFLITETAKANLEQYTKEGGYRSPNDFINDLLLHLDDLLR